MDGFDQRELEILRGKTDSELQEMWLRQPQNPPNRIAAIAQVLGERFVLQESPSHLLEYVGFGSRGGAALIDGVLTGLITVPLLLAKHDTEYWNQTDLVADSLIFYVLLAAIVIPFWNRFSATPGKMAVGATIVDARTGGKPTTSQFLVRYLGYFVSGIVLLLGFIGVGVDARKQGWHDRMAGTVVVRRNRGAAEPVRLDDGSLASPQR